MNRKLIGGAAALLVAAVAVWFLWLRDRGEAEPGLQTGSAATRSGDVPTAPGTRVKTNLPVGIGADGKPTKWVLDRDADGPLGLEGQVLGPDGKGAAKAIVKIESVPPRTVTTEDDGTFAFDKLFGRSYSLAATSGELVGSLEFNLTSASGPAVIHLRAGVSLEITIVDEPGKPIAGASVHEGGEEEPVVTTDDKGIAKLKAIKPGWIRIDASAPGYAPNSTVTTVGSAGGSGTVQITLRKGYAVSGKVIDEGGKPVVNAKVNATADNWGMRTDADDEDVITNAAGEFKIPALAPGSVPRRLVVALACRNYLPHCARQLWAS